MIKNNSFIIPGPKGFLKSEAIFATNLLGATHGAGQSFFIKHLSHQAFGKFPASSKILT
jgi:hypothetical protein